MSNKKTKQKRTSNQKNAVKRGKKKPLLIAAGCTVFVVLAIFIIWYVSRSGLVKLKLQNGAYTDSVNGVSYLSADVNYEPIAVGEAYADYEGVILYKISGLDPAVWLTEEFSGIGAVYHADTLTLPGLADWQSDGIRICEVGEITIQKTEVTNTDEIAAIVAAATGDSLESEPSGAASGDFDVYHLKFTSPVYTGLYYDILYLDDGTNAYFYDRSTKLYYDAGELLLGYLPRVVQTG